jgi:iron uptake system EfeUOB component EfeO/EfeM
MVRGIQLAAVLVVAGLLTFTDPAPAHASRRPCSSYPTPGMVAPANARVPAVLRARYAILRRPQRAVDRLRPNQISTSLTASGLILSGIRLLGHAAFGGRIYLVPAQHLLAFRIAPPRCLPPGDRSLEHELLPELRREYVHPALCVVVIHAGTDLPSCGAALGNSEALLYSGGTPGFGLVPDGVRAVTVSYASAPPRTLAVHDNFFTVIAPRQSAAPCGLQWLDPTGNVIKTVTGCSLIPLETQPLGEYRTYVAGELATLQSQVVTLITAIASGSLAQAQAAWLTAHVTWLDIGQDDGAYGCFGELGRQIDGTAAGLPAATASPDFTGFHKIELDLFTSQSLPAAMTDAEELQSLITELVAIPLATELPATKNGIANWVIRPHEILEDANRDTLTGDDDYGSGTGLASLSADVAATEEFLYLLAPVIDPLAPDLVGRARRELAGLSTEIQVTRSGGEWVAIANLPSVQREQIDADTGAALQTLSRIPDLLTSTGDNAPSN